MSDKPKRRWYSFRVGAVVWVLLIVLAIFVFDLVRDFYFGDNWLQ